MQRPNTMVDGLPWIHGNHSGDHQMESDEKSCLTINLIEKYEEMMIKQIRLLTNDKCVWENDDRNDDERSCNDEIKQFFELMIIKNSVEY